MDKGIIKSTNILTSEIKNICNGGPLAGKDFDSDARAPKLVSKFILYLKDCITTDSIPDSNKRFIAEILQFTRFGPMPL